MWVWEVVALCFVGTFFLLAFSLALYMIYKCLMVILATEGALFREFRAIPAAFGQPAKTTESMLGSQLREFIANRLKPTEGDFVGNTDEDFYIQEQIKFAEAQGMNAEEIEAFIRQAVTSKGEPG